MGKSLQLQNNGTYVAFASGTGVLPFMDAIGYLILSLVSQNQNYTDLYSEFPESSFKLIMFSVFRDDQEAVGLDLLQGLTNLCNKLNKPLFDHRLTLTSKAKTKEYKQSSYY